MPVPNILKDIVRAVLRFARWYVQRRRITKVLIFMAFFMPILLYSYWLASVYTAKYSVSVLVTTETYEPHVNWSAVPCSALFRGKTLFIFGVLALPSSCFLINSSTYMYLEGSRATVIFTEGNSSYPIGFVFVFPTNTSIRVSSSRTISVSKEIIVIYSNSTSADWREIAWILRKHNMVKTFCSTAIPSTASEWGTRYVPEALYDHICLSGSP